MKYIRSKIGNKTIFRVVEEGFEDSNKKVNSVDSNLLTAHSINHKQGYKEGGNNPSTEADTSCPLPLLKNAGSRSKDHVTVETNLEKENTDVLSISFGEVIADVLVDEFITSQRSNMRAIVGK